MSTRNFEVAVQQERARLEKLHPTVDDIPGCMTLLDTFLRCTVPGSQVRSLYRFGEMNQCMEKWEDVKFCLSLKQLSLDERRSAWLLRRAEWWATRRVGRSSEDIWDIRTEPPPPREYRS
ncbi:hypothetical protein BS47DRAFT_1345804 [Hydnum rufescens UP504]|uniref:Early meiotic induction protein 1 n=1 Tax=Hydnum rufescens UP504 TaxID=1448309 RepID=A0A9P6AUC5_9AGAM|nr:hypothetical protein BS47DRAFT_1345804 [Hydnum rufescens UP504]